MNEIIDWARSAPAELFPESSAILKYVEPYVGKGQTLNQRKAIVLEVMRVLAGLESSWRWECGRDSNSTEPPSPLTDEAGIFQCSCNAKDSSSSLKDFLLAEGLTSDCPAFILRSKADHDFAIEVCARLLNENTDQHHFMNSQYAGSDGPNDYLHVWLRKDAVDEFLRYIEQ